MESPIRGEKISNRENEPPIKKASGRRRALAHERIRSSKASQVAAFNRARGILNVRRVLDGVVNVENEKAFKRGSSLQEEKMYTPPTSLQKVVQRSETSPLLRVSLLSSFHKSQDTAVKPCDDKQRIVRKPFSGERNEEKCRSNEEEKANEAENVNLDVEKKQKGDLSVTNSAATTTPLMNVLLEVSRPSSRTSWHSPSSVEFSRTPAQTPPSELQDRPDMQLKDVMFGAPTPLAPMKGTPCENMFPSRVLRGSKSYDVSGKRPFEDLITTENKNKLAEYYSHPRFNVLKGRISCERSLRKEFFPTKDNTDAMAVKEELQKNKSVRVRSRNTKHKSRNLVRRLLCCSRQHISSSSSTNSDISVKLSRSRILKNSVVGTNTSRSWLTHKTTQTLFAHSEKLFPQDEKQVEEKAYYIPKCDQSTATEKETIEFQETGVDVIPVHVKCSTTLSIKNKVDGQTRTIKFSDNEIIIEMTGKETDDIGPKVERLVIKPSKDNKNTLPQYLEINRTRSTNDIRTKTSKTDIPYVASIPAWIWSETPMIFSKTKRDTIFKKISDSKDVSNEPSTANSKDAAPVTVTEEETSRNNEPVEQQKAETGNINPHKLISCYMVDVINEPSSSNNPPSRNEGTVNEMKQRKTKVRKDTGTQTTFNFPEVINAFCQTAECPQRDTDTDAPERELLYVDYERQRPADKPPNYPQRVSPSGSRMVLINISNDPDPSVPPVIVNLSQATTSAFKAAAYEHEIEQRKFLQRTASLLSSHQTTGADAPLRTTKLNEATPSRRTVTDLPRKEKTTDDYRTNSQRVKGESLIERERRISKLDVQSKDKETDDRKEIPLPHIISTSRPFLHLGESILVQDQSTDDAKPEVSRKIEIKQNSESATEKLSSANTPLTQRKQRQYFETDRSSLPRGETEIGRKSADQNLKNTRKTRALDITGENRSSQLKNAEFLSRRATEVERQKIKEREHSRSLMSDPQRASAIDNSKNTSVAFKKTDFLKEEVKNVENTNFQPVQSTSQSESFIKPSETSVLFVLNDGKLFQGKGKRERFAARAGGRAPAQRGRPRGFGPSAPAPARPDHDPGPKKGKGPQKVPLVFGSPSGSFDDTEKTQTKKGKAPQKAAAVARPPSDDLVMHPKKKEEKPQVTPKRAKAKNSSDEDSDEHNEITPFPVTMLGSLSTSSSAASSLAGSTSESVKSAATPGTGGTDSTVVSDVESSEAESSDAAPERGRKSSTRSRRSSSRASELRRSARDSDVTPEAIRSTLDEGAAPPQEDLPPGRVSEVRSSLRGSKYLPDMIISSVDEAITTKPDEPPSVATEQRRSQRGSSVGPDSVADARKSSVKDRAPQPPPRSSLRDSQFLPNLVLSTTDDAIKSSQKQDRSSSGVSGPRSVAGSTSSRQRVAGGDPDVLPGRLSSTSDDARKSRDSSRSSEHRSLIRRSDFFPDTVLPTIPDPSENQYVGTSVRVRPSARSSSGERPLEDARVRPSGRSRESSTYGSKPSLYGSSLHSAVFDADEDTASRLHSIDRTKSLERKYTLPDSDVSSEEIFQDTVVSKSRDLATDVPDSSAVEPPSVDSDKPRSKEWDSSDLPATVTDVDLIPDESDSKYFAQVEDFEDEIKEHEARPLSGARDHVRGSSARPDTRVPPCYMDARAIAKQERRQIHKDSCQPLPRTEKGALNNMCEMFCNIFPCCRKFSVCCKRKNAYARRTAPPQPAKQRKRRSSKSSITSSELCGRCEKCESATMSLQGVPIIRPSDRPDQQEITVGYNFTNLYGVYMLLEQSNNSESVRVQNFAENMFSGAINPRVYANSSSSCIFPDMQIKNKRKESNMCSSELSSNLSTSTFRDFKHIPHFSAQEAALNDALCKEDGFEDSEKNMFTSTTPFTLTGTTATSSGSNEIPSQCREQGLNSPPTNSCLSDLRSPRSKKLVLGEFYSKNYRKEKSLISQAKKKFQKKISSQVIDVNFQSMKQQDVKKGNIFDEYTTNSGSHFTNNRNTENITPHSLSQKWSENCQHLLERNCDIGMDVTRTWNKLYEDLTEGKVKNRRRQTLNCEPYYDVNKEHLKRRKKECVHRLEKKSESSSQAIIDDADTKNVTNDLKINLKNLYKNICEKSRNEIHYRKTKKIKEEMIKIQI